MWPAVSSFDKSLTNEIVPHGSSQELQQIKRTGIPKKIALGQSNACSSIGVNMSICYSWYPTACFPNLREFVAAKRCDEHLNIKPIKDFAFVADGKRSIQVRLAVFDHETERRELTR